MKNIVFFVLLTVSIAFGQTSLYPSSLSTDRGITITTLGGVPHHQVGYYDSLITVMKRELSICDTGYSIRLVFMPDTLKKVLQYRNPYEGSFNEDWVGFYFDGAHVILMTEDNDATFFHEMLHYFYDVGEFFPDVDAHEIHLVIYTDENLLLVSDTYLKFLLLHKL